MRPSSPKASVGSAAPDGLGVPPPGRSATELPPPWDPTLEEVGGVVESQLGYLNHPWTCATSHKVHKSHQGKSLALVAERNHLF